MIADLNNITEGKLDFTIGNEKTIKMTSNGTGYFPIAVKANKLHFDNGEFVKLSLLTDRNGTFKSLQFTLG